MSERRQFARADFDTTIQEEFFGGKQSAHTVDLSEEGIRYFHPTATPKEPGELVFLEFRLPREPTPIQVVGEVAGGFGDEIFQSTSVSFAFVKTCDRRKIRAYVERWNPQRSI